MKVSAQTLGLTVKTLLITGAAALLLAGCGENYQAVYSGQVAFSGCTAANQAYNADIAATVSGSSVSVQIISLTPTAGGTVDRNVTALLSLQPISTSLSGDTQFNWPTSSDSNFSNPTTRLQGTLSRTRDELDNFDLYTYSALTVGSTQGSCKVEVQGSSLKVKP